jgi:hypothetical protein
MSNTSKFIKAFDSQKESHVKWLSHMIDIAESMGDPEANLNLISYINNNPFNIKLDKKDALDWPHIHFCLCGVYAKAVLRGEGFVPVCKI